MKEEINEKNREISDLKEEIEQLSLTKLTRSSSNGNNINELSGNVFSQRSLININIGSSFSIIMRPTALSTTESNASMDNVPSLQFNTGSTSVSPNAIFSPPSIQEMQSKSNEMRVLDNLEVPSLSESFERCKSV